MRVQCLGKGEAKRNYLDYLGLGTGQGNRNYCTEGSDGQWNGPGVYSEIKQTWRLPCYLRLYRGYYKDPLRHSWT